VGSLQILGKKNAEEVNREKEYSKIQG